MEFIDDFPIEWVQIDHVLRVLKNMLDNQHPVINKCLWKEYDFERKIIIQNEQYIVYNGLSKRSNIG